MQKSVLFDTKVPDPGPDCALAGDYHHLKNQNLSFRPCEGQKNYIRNNNKKLIYICQYTKTGFINLLQNIW